MNTKQRASGFGAKSILTITANVVIALSVLLICISYISVYDVLHPPRIIPPGYTLVKARVEFRSIDLTTQDGIRLSAWYTPPKNGVVILLAHGYGDNRPEWMYAMLAKNDYGVLAWDARAHGESDGKISTIGFLETLDVKAALNYALAQPTVEHVGAWGGSMGGATLIRATAQFPGIEALVVDSSFTSLNDEFNFLVPYPVINPLAKIIMNMETGISVNDVSPVDDIVKISPRPVYIIQGTGDKVASPNSGEELFNAAKEPRYLWVKENIPHLAMALDNPRRYERRVVAFFDEYLLNKK